MDKKGEETGLKRVWKPEDKLKILQEVEGGAKIVEVCRKYQINSRMYYTWKERYQEGIEGLEDKRRRHLYNCEVSNREYLRLQKENENLKGFLRIKS